MSSHPEPGILLPQQCSGCTHWYRLPDPAGPRDLSRKPVGQCRESPPDCMAVPGPQGLAMIVRYKELPADFQACDRYEERDVPA